jgi:hypothetical protein
MDVEASLQENSREKSATHQTVDGSEIQKPPAPRVIAVDPLSYLSFTHDIHEHKPCATNFLTVPGSGMWITSG